MSKISILLYRNTDTELNHSNLYCQQLIPKLMTGFMSITQHEILCLCIHISRTFLKMVENHS
jgi:hypothetical protein